MSRPDVIIIGSGISALTSAVLLGQKGKKVLVLERYSKPGGYMHSFRRFGETFDTGAHYMGSLAPGQAFHTLLNHLGVYDESLFERLDESAFDVLHFPKGVVNFPMGYENVINELSAVFPMEKDAIRKYFHKIRTICDFFPTYRYDDSQQLMIPAEALEVSLKSVVESLTQNRELQSVFYAYCNLHGAFPEDVAFGFHAIVTDSLIEGAYGLRGGGDALTKKFIERIESLGGEVRCRQEVTAFRTRVNQIHEVETAASDVFQAEWIISSIHPKATFALLDERKMLTPAFENRLKSIRESIGIFGIYSTFKSRPGLPPNRNHYFFKSDDPKAMFAPPVPSETPGVVFMSSPKRTWLADEKKFPMSLHAAGPFEWFAPWAGEKYGKRSAEYGEFKEKWARQIFRAVDDYVPGFSDGLDSYATSSPITHLHFNSTPEGSSYGLYHSIQNTGARALGPRTKVLNLLLTGQNCLFPGLLGAATSALRTCGHITGIKPLLHDLKTEGARACASSSPAPAH